MKAKNQRFTFDTPQEMWNFKKEVEWMGRYVPSYSLEKLEVTVSPFPERYKKKTEAERKAKAKTRNSYDDNDYEAVAKRYG